MIIELGNESDFQDKIIVYPDIHVSINSKLKTFIINSRIDMKNISILYWNKIKYKKWENFYNQSCITSRMSVSFLKKYKIDYRDSKKLKFNNITFFIPMTQKEYVKWKLVS